MSASQQAANRADGRFVKGVSGNPAGRPKGLQAMCREFTPQAIKALVDALDCPRERVAAAQALLDRGWGKPVQTIAGDPDNPLQSVSYVVRAPAPVDNVDDWLKLYAPKTIDGGTAE